MGNIQRIETVTDDYLANGFDLDKVILHKELRQNWGYGLTGDDLKERLKGKKFLNDDVLNYLFKNKNLIPDSWKVDEEGKTRNISFFGTEYFIPGGKDFMDSTIVTFMYWKDEQWYWYYRNLRDFGWGAQDYVAILKD